MADDEALRLAVAERMCLLGNTPAVRTPGAMQLADSVIVLVRHHDAQQRAGKEASDGEA